MREIEQRRGDERLLVDDRGDILQRPLAARGRLGPGDHADDASRPEGNGHPNAALRDGPLLRHAIGKAVCSGSGSATSTARSVTGRLYARPVPRRVASRRLGLSHEEEHVIQPATLSRRSFARLAAGAAAATASPGIWRPRPRRPALSASAPTRIPSGPRRRRWRRSGGPTPRPGGIRRTRRRAAGFRRAAARRGARSRSSSVRGRPRS